MPMVLLLAVALQAPATAPSPPAVPPAADTDKPEAPSKGLLKSVRATLVAIDAEHMTVRFTDEKGEQKAWPVDRVLVDAFPHRAEALAKALQPGAPIYVTYHEDEGQPTITDLTRRTAADDEMDLRDSRRGKR